MFIQTVHNSLFGAVEKDRNGVPVVAKKRTGTAFRSSKKKNRNGVPVRSGSKRTLASSENGTFGSMS